MKISKGVLPAATVAVLVAFTFPVFAAQQAGEMTLDEKEAARNFRTRGYSPYADRGFPTMPLWGDTHLHTANSPDAFAFGNRLTPEDAYRFARGETVTAAAGKDASRATAGRKGTAYRFAAGSEAGHSTWQ